MRDDYFVMFNRGEEQYQVSCPLGSATLGWSGEYALLDDDGKVCASTLGEERLERMKTAYPEVKDIWLCRK